MDIVSDASIPDLVPRENAQRWLRYLRHYTPPLPFRSAASNQRSNVSCATAPALLRPLKAYKPSAAQGITVGMIRFAKSSLIPLPSLIVSETFFFRAVAAQPGHIKDLQTVQLVRGLKIIDSPGVVFDKDEDDGGVSQRQEGSILLCNVVKVEVSMIRLLSVSHSALSLKCTANHTSHTLCSGGNPFTNRTRGVAKDIRPSRILEHARVSDHVGTEQRKASQGLFTHASRAGH